MLYKVLIIDYTGGVVGGVDDNRLSFRPDASPNYIQSGCKLPVCGQNFSHAAMIVKNPEFGPEGISYELKPLEPYEEGYWIAGGILDMDAPSVTPKTGMMWPERVMVYEDRPTENIDLILVDTALFFSAEGT